MLEPSLLDLINDFYATKHDFSQYIGRKNDVPVEQLESLQVQDDDNHVPPYKSLVPLEIHRAVLARDRNKENREIDKSKMPVHPAEEKTSGSITDQVAKDSKDSTASSHPLHQEDTGATSGGAVGAMAHKANPGPVMAENMPEPASKEELKKRAEELNK